MKHSNANVTLTLLWLGATLQATAAQELKSIDLPPAQKSGGKPLMETLAQRQTGREIRSQALPLPVLGNLLWAAFGVNRPDTGHRTAPSAMNAQEVDLYVALPEALYLYNAQAHKLTPVFPGDFRAKTSGQEFARNAGAVLILVADFDRMVKAKPETKPFYSALDGGCLVQNIYLFCASEGLASVVYDLDRPPLAAAMKLRPTQHILIAQAVGYPAGLKVK